MDELLLLRDYVTTMERQLQSKNRQIKTLTEQNQKLRSQIQNLSQSQTRSYLVTSNASTICNQCTKTKKQLFELQSICNTLQIKYDSLEKQKSNSLTSSVRVVSSSCSECNRLKRELQEINTKYNNLEKNQSSYISSPKIYSAAIANCTQCSQIKSDLFSKQSTITRLNTQILSKNTTINNLQSQIEALTKNSLKSPTYTQNLSSSNDIQRLTYLNGQVEQYIALINSLRSQIKVLNDQNQKYTFRIRDLENRPKQIQYIDKGLSPEIKEEILSLKVQIGQLSNDNILLRRQNAQLKRQVMNLPKNSQIIIQTIPYQQPVRFNDVMYDERPSKHYRKSPLSKNNRSIITQSPRFSRNQQLRYQDLQRKISLLQVQNSHLRGNIYSNI